MRWKYKYWYASKYVVNGVLFEIDRDAVLGRREIDRGAIRRL